MEYLSAERSACIIGVKSGIMVKTVQTVISVVELILTSPKIRHRHYHIKVILEISQSPNSPVAMREL